MGLKHGVLGHYQDYEPEEGERVIVMTEYPKGGCVYLSVRRSLRDIHVTQVHWHQDGRRRGNQGNWEYLWWGRVPLAHVPWVVQQLQELMEVADGKV